MMFTGLTLANVLGLSLGTALSQAMGWRATFWAVTMNGVVAAAALAVCLPKHIGMSKTSLLLHEFTVLKNLRVVMLLFISVLSSASLFSTFTYITPTLETVVAFAPHNVTPVLLLFGLGLTMGGTLGGKLADWRVMPSLVAFLATIIAALTIFTATMPAMATVFVWGMLTFAMIPPLQILIVGRASRAPNLASTLNQGTFNLSNGTGAWRGGVAIDGGAPLTSLPWVGAGIAVGALALTAV